MSVKAARLSFGLLALGFCALKDPVLCTGFFVLGCVYLLVRFRKITLIVLWVLMAGYFAFRLFQPVPAADPGVYSVSEIHGGYAVLEKDGNRVLLYDKEDIGFDSLVDVRSFEPIQSLNNLNLFSFEDFMKDKGILYSADSVSSIQPGRRSLKGILFDWIAGHPQAELYQMFFYQFSFEKMPEWMAQMGLGALGLLTLVRSALSRIVVPKRAGWITLGFGILFGIGFGFPASLIRFLLFLFASLTAPDFESRFALGSSLFLMICPQEARSLSLILPVAVSFASHFQTGRLARSFCSKIICAALQVLYFSGLSWISLCGYRMMKKVFGLLFLLSLPGLLFPGWANGVLSLIHLLSFQGSGMLFERAPGLLFQAGLVWLVTLMCRRLDVRTILVSLVLFAGWITWPSIDPFFHVYSLSIGQGDCTLIVEPFGKSAIMIDAAGNLSRDNAEKIIVPFLKSLHVTELDALIITHDDFDHSGAKESLMEKFSVRQLVEDHPQPVSVDYPFEFLLPERDETLDENNRSLITYFRYDGFSYLFTGDAQKEIEQKLVESYDIQADILKLGHHGSDTSSIPAFLKAVTPRLGLISSGYHNRYGHPSLQTLKNCAAQGIDTLNTAKSGMIHLFSWRNILFVECADGTFSILSAKPGPA